MTDTHDAAAELDIRANEEISSGETAEVRGVRVISLSIAASIVAALLMVAAVLIIVQLMRATNESELVHDRYDECADASSELMVASDYLTTECRMFVVTGERRFMDSYVEELTETRRRDEAVATLTAHSGNERAAEDLIAALSQSNELATVELYAMKLECEALDISPMPGPVEAATITAADEALPPDEKRARAQDLVLNDAYAELKSSITSNVDACASDLVKGLESRIFDLERSMDRLLLALVVVATLLVLLVVAISLANYVLVTRPMRIHERRLRKGEPLDIMGSVEIKRVATSYNSLLAEVTKRTADLKHEAETDALTGVFNRGTYDHLLETQMGDFALILADVDHFKQVNDQFGHEAGDEVLKRVASALVSHFRSTDHVCRIGGDEFAVIAVKATPENQDVINAKLTAVATEVASAPAGTPQVTMSFGVAFSGDENANLYHNADKALYRSKRAGRSRASFYNEQG